MGIEFSLTDIFTDPTMPVLYDDAILSSGSLVLNDLTHSLGGVTGVPAAGAPLPNVAWLSANQLVAGAPGQAALSSVLDINAAIPGASYPLAERTTKKGLHLVRSQANDAGSDHAQILLAAAVKAYILANQQHSYYASLWQQFTRPFKTSGSPYPGVFMLGQDTGNNLLGQQPNVNPISGVLAIKQLGASVTGSGGLATGPALTQAAVSGVTGNISANSLFAALLFGGSGGAFSGLHVGASQVFYRFYLEDLTISGRTFAQVKAIDDALYTAAYAAGGKLAGDTFTDPAGYP